MAEQTRAPASPTQSSSSPSPGGRFNRDTSGMVNPFDKANKASKTFTYPESLNPALGKENEHTHWIAFYPLVEKVPMRQKHLVVEVLFLKLQANKESMQNMQQPLVLH